MKVLLFQLDGSFPNLALMRISAHHKAAGDFVELRCTGQPDRLLHDAPDRVYASAIFLKTQPVVDRLMRSFPFAIVGGTGVSLTRTVEGEGIATLSLDYTIYPKWRQSIGFTQRGCRLKCGFCVVPKKEGKMQETASIADIWRGDKWPRQLILMDNDFFGQPHWRERVEEIRDGGFKVDFNQGINARFLTDEAAEAIGSIDYRACTMDKDSGLRDMKTRRIYTAWDNRKDEQRLFDGLNRLVKYGVKPDHIMVYVLVGYWPGETEEDRLFRVQRLRDFGARPYPMPFTRTSELIGFQRWVVGAYDKRIPWHEWKAANCQPRNLGDRGKTSLPVLFSEN